MIMLHIEELLFDQFVNNECLLLVGGGVREFLPDCVIKKMQEFCDEYNGCPCFDCRYKYFCHNEEVQKQLIERCLVPFIEYYQFKFGEPVDPAKNGSKELERLYDEYNEYEYEKEVERLYFKDLFKDYFEQKKISNIMNKCMYYE